MEIEFEEFEPEFMQHFNGYVPIYVSFEDSELLKNIKDDIREKQTYVPGLNFKRELAHIKSAFIEKGRGSQIKINAHIEMICPYRMSDGPTRFYRYYTVNVTNEQVTLISEWMNRAGEWWKDHFNKQATNALIEDED